MKSSSIKPKSNSKNTNSTNIEVITLDSDKDGEESEDNLRESRIQPITRNSNNNQEIKQISGVALRSGKVAHQSQVKKPINKRETLRNLPSSKPVNQGIQKPKRRYRKRGTIEINTDVLASSRCNNRVFLDLDQEQTEDEAESDEYSKREIEIALALDREYDELIKVKHTKAMSSNAEFIVSLIHPKCKYQDLKTFQNVAIYPESILRTKKSNKKEEEKVKEEMNDESKEIDNIKNKDWLVRCLLCSCGFLYDFADLYLHFGRNHPGMVITSDFIRIKPARCPRNECTGRMFTSFASLRRHFWMVHGGFVDFLSSEEKKLHVQVHKLYNELKFENQLALQEIRPNKRKQHLFLKLGTN